MDSAQCKPRAEFLINKVIPGLCQVDLWLFQIGNFRDGPSPPPHTVTC